MKINNKKNQVLVDPSPSSTTTHGTLYVVATPIGNLDDWSRRAITTLRDKVTIIACEDTRHSRILLQHYAINTPTISLHAHNEVKRSCDLIDRLQQGESVALISDAGTPHISDPGGVLIAAAHQKNIPVSPIAGPCAAIAALSASGMSSDSFTFFGFLPPKGSRRNKRLRFCLSFPSTIIFYESPHRIVDFFKRCLTEDKNSRRYCLAREISKKYETIIQGGCQELLDYLEQNPNKVKGEYVVIAEEIASIKGKNPESYQDSEQNLSPEKILNILMQEVSKKQAVDLCCQITGLKKNYVYKLSLSL